jgi:hypothetical protein
MLLTIAAVVMTARTRALVVARDALPVRIDLRIRSGGIAVRYQLDPIPYSTVRTELQPRFVIGRINFAI